MIRVGNKHKGDKGVYIGRGSPLGNPYRLKSAGGEFTRDEAVDEYEVYLFEKLLTNDKPVVAELRRIKELSRKGDVTLVCFCAPQRCHGDVIKNFVEEML